ncbi:MAG TPA: BamA/TamA family outer membrane protein [Kofleriaceae bacterium]|nr:BamA/TamA family outer membrane protein [Kofleriaceae bacterium]
MLCPETGHTQPVASTVEPPARPARDQTVIEPTPQPAPEPTAADVAGAPVPGQESGRLDRIDGGDSTPRLIGRGFLFLPKVAIQAALAPIRAGIWANERYHLFDRAQGVMFNEPGTMGLYPRVGLESGFGVNVGAKFVHRDLFGAREHLGLSASTGGRFRREFEVSLRSGKRFGEHVKLSLKGEHDRRPRERFFGIGNHDEVPVPIEPLDALDTSGGEPIAVETRYRQQLLRGTAVAEVHVARDLHVFASGALTDFEVGRSEDGPPIDEVYMSESLVGWGGARLAYSELELRWDSRRALSSWEPKPVYSGGWLASVYGGRAHRLDAGPDYWRYGADLQRFFRLARGPRVLAARAHVEAVSGAQGEVPFFELPELGGAKLLRGYETERFRDRIAAVGSLDYQWDLSQMFSARLFTDVGRVYASADELALTGLRVGYGAGLDLHTRSSFWLRSSIASSIDGGIFLNLAFEPAFELDRRVEQR